MEWGALQSMRRLHPSSNSLSSNSSASEGGGRAGQHQHPGPAIFAPVQGIP
jgi:hypothetical protein